MRYFEIINDQFFCTDSEEDCLSFNVVRWESNEKWSEIVDEFIYSCLLLSDIYFKDKNTDSALEILNRGISLEPSWSEDLFYLRGLIKSLLGDNYGALSDFKRVNELISSANKSSLLEYYKSLQDEKGIQEVFDNYNFIQVLGGAVGRSGILKKEMGDYEGAINDLKESVKSYPLLGITSAEIELEGYKPKPYL